MCQKSTPSSWKLSKNEYFLDAGLSVIQLLYEHARAPRSQPSLQILRHKGNAMEKLREKISSTTSAVDNVTIFTTIFLAALEKALRNSVAHDVHKRNIVAAISHQGWSKSLRGGVSLTGCVRL